MIAPRIEIDLDKIQHNTRVLVARLATRNIQVVGVTKATLGSPGIATAMLRGGAVGLGDSRVENLARLLDLDVTVPRTLIRAPMPSQARQAVRTATISLNTEPAVIKALDEAASRTGSRHGVILMVELGDLREGIAPHDIEAAVRSVLSSRHLRLVGLGTNLACQNGVIPDDENMSVLHRLVASVERGHRVQLDVISAGNSASLGWAMATDDLGRTNELRLGESILLGTEPLHRRPIPGLHIDACTLVGEVIEVAQKPARPWGTQAQAAYGTPPRHASPGTRRQAIIALGRQDVDLEGLRPPAGITVLGMSSDHLVLDVGDHRVAVGDEITFSLGYGALVRAMTSPFVSKIEHTTIVPLIRPGRSPLLTDVARAPARSMA